MLASEGRLEELNRVCITRKQKFEMSRWERSWFSSDEWNICLITVANIIKVIFLFLVFHPKPSWTVFYFTLTSKDYLVELVESSPLFWVIELVLIRGLAYYWIMLEMFNRGFNMIIIIFKMRVNTGCGRCRLRTASSRARSHSLFVNKHQYWFLDDRSDAKWHCLFITLIITMVIRILKLEFLIWWNSSWADDLGEGYPVELLVTWFGYPCNKTFWHISLSFCILSRTAIPYCHSFRIFAL